MEVDENLLSAPGSTAGIEDYQKPLSRKKCSYKNTCEVFRDDQQAKKEYSRQYSHIYFSRLMEMSQMVEKKAKEKWGNNCECKKLSELGKLKGQECVVIGTIFKQMDLKPSILKEISAKNHLAPPPPRSRYVSSTDKLILEDQMQRVVLKWEESGAESESRLPGPLEEELVTGVVVGVLGREMEKGEFLVKDVCFAGPLPMAEEEEEEMEEEMREDRYVLFVSGWNLGSSSCDQLSIEMMVDYVTGQLGGANDADLSSSIVQVILAGNSVTDKPVKSSSLTKTTQSRFLTRNYSAECLEAVKELDNILCQLSSCVPVDLMPGSHDPTNFQLPQQPMHKCMFPKSGQHKNLMGVTNPYSASIGGRSFTGTSGENILDIRRFTVVTDSLRILENTLHWGHLAPTAPDTLACYPYAKKDPFILKHTPDVYFAGNQPKFQKKTITVEGRPVLVVCIPEYDKSHSCVLVNLANLDCQELKFTTSRSATPSSKSVGGPGEVGGADEEGEDSEVYVPVEENMSILNHMDDQDDFED